MRKHIHCHPCNGWGFQQEIEETGLGEKGDRISHLVYLPLPHGAQFTKVLVVDTFAAGEFLFLFRSNFQICH